MQNARDTDTPSPSPTFTSKDTETWTVSNVSKITEWHWVVEPTGLSIVCHDLPTFEDGFLQLELRNVPDNILPRREECSIW